MTVVWCWWCLVGDAGSLGGNELMSISMITEDLLLAYGPNRRRIVVDGEGGDPGVVSEVTDGCRSLRGVGRSNDHDVVRSSASA